jgi:hypothetical protein
MLAAYRRTGADPPFGDPRGYHGFQALNTKPSVTYLARVVHEQEA